VFSHDSRHSLLYVLIPVVVGNKTANYFTNGKICIWRGSVDLINDGGKLFKWIPERLCGTIEPISGEKLHRRNVVLVGHEVDPKK